MAKKIPTIGESASTRPWYKKKRFVIPLGFFLFVGFVGAFGSNESGEYDDSADQAELEARPEIIEGIMPDYVGLTAAEVAETLEELDLRGNEVYWPTRFEPRDKEFVEEASVWFVCEQEQQPGEELDISYKLWLGWGQDCSNYKVVPNIVGMAGGDASTLARSRGLTVDYSTSSKERPFCTQDIPAGTRLPAGKLDRKETEINGVLRDDCDAYFEEQAVYEAEAQKLAEEKAAREEQEARLKDPNTFEGGRKFINFHKEWLANDIALIDAYRSWLEIGAPLDNPLTESGPILDALLGRIPYMPGVYDDMWEKAPEAYQERWSDIRERLKIAEDAHDEARSLWVDDVYSDSELIPYAMDVRKLAVEALNLVNSMPYPQQ